MSNNSNINNINKKEDINNMLENNRKQNSNTNIGANIITNNDLNIFIGSWNMAGVPIDPEEKFYDW